MSNGILLVPFFAFGLVAGGCGRSDDVSPTGREEPIRADWGVVLSGEEAQQLLKTCSRPRPPGFSGARTPGRTEIDRLEKRLPAVLGHALARILPEEGQTVPVPTDYYRQYAGFYQRGQRVVYINGLHRHILEFPGREDLNGWTRKAMGGCDLGASAFGLVYDVDTDRFGAVDFDGRFNGEVRMRWF